MKKIICKKEYDTETATLIKAYSFGQMGDPTGYEEDLYQTPEGLYFLHVGGGGYTRGIFRTSEVRKFRFSVLSLTELMSAGLWKMSEASSSIREMFLPPKAIACDDVGRFRKSKMDELPCA